MIGVQLVKELLNKWQEIEVFRKELSKYSRGEKGLSRSTFYWAKETKQGNR